MKWNKTVIVCALYISLKTMRKYKIRLSAKTVNPVLGSQLFHNAKSRNVEMLLRYILRRCGQYWLTQNVEMQKILKDGRTINVSGLYYVSSPGRIYCFLSLSPVYLTVCLKYCALHNFTDSLSYCIVPKAFIFCTWVPWPTNTIKQRSDLQGSFPRGVGEGGGGG